MYYIIELIMLKTWISAAKIGTKTLLLYAGTSMVCAVFFVAFILIELSWKEMPDIHWLGLPSIVWLFLFIIAIIDFVVIGIFIGTKVATEKVLQYLLIEYEPYLWEYILKYIKKRHSGEITLNALQNHIQNMNTQINDLPFLIKRAVLLFIKLFPVAEMIYNKTNLLAETNFDEKKVAEALAKEKNEIVEVKINQSPWLVIIVSGQTLLFITYQFFR